MSWSLDDSIYIVNWKSIEEKFSNYIKITNSVNRSLCWTLLDDDDEVFWVKFDFIDFWVLENTIYSNKYLWLKENFYNSYVEKNSIEALDYVLLNIDDLILWKKLLSFNFPIINVERFFFKAFYYIENNDSDWLNNLVISDLNLISSFSLLELKDLVYLLLSVWLIDTANILISEFWEFLLSEFDIEFFSNILVTASSDDVDLSKINFEYDWLSLNIYDWLKYYVSKLVNNELKSPFLNAFWYYSLYLFNIWETEEANRLLNEWLLRSDWFSIEIISRNTDDKDLKSECLRILWCVEKWYIDELLQFFSNIWDIEAIEWLVDDDIYNLSDYIDLKNWWEDSDDSSDEISTTEEFTEEEVSHNEDIFSSPSNHFSLSSGNKNLIDKDFVISNSKSIIFFFTYCVEKIREWNNDFIAIFNRFYEKLTYLWATINFIENKLYLFIPDVSLIVFSHELNEDITDYLYPSDTLSLNNNLISWNIRSYISWLLNLWFTKWLVSYQVKFWNVLYNKIILEKDCSFITDLVSIIDDFEDKLDIDFSTSSSDMLIRHDTNITQSDKLLYRLYDYLKFTADYRLSSNIYVPTEIFRKIWLISSRLSNNSPISKEMFYYLDYFTEIDSWEIDIENQSIWIYNNKFRDKWSEWFTNWELNIH